MSFEEFIYVNEQRMAYMDFIIDKHRGMANRAKREIYYDKLKQWRDVAFIIHNSKQSMPEQTWDLIRL